MANERMYPILPCADLDDTISFYEALGFRRTYRQLRPNPSAVVVREDMHIHLAGIDGFDPRDSYGSVIITVPDPAQLYLDFAEGLKKTFGKLPVAGIPRILRPRKKYGTVSGFTVVDPGGNWLRVYKQDDTEEEAAAEEVESLEQFVRVAARLGDAKGDETAALQSIKRGLERYPQAPALERAKAYLYQAELAIRVDDKSLAHEAFAAANSQPLTKDEQESLADEFSHVSELVQPGKES